MTQEGLNPFIPESPGKMQTLELKGLFPEKHHVHFTSKRPLTERDLGWCLRRVFTEEVEYTHHQSFLGSPSKGYCKVLRQLECTHACTAQGLESALCRGLRAVFSNTDLSLPFKLPSSLSNLNTEISCNTPELC